MARVKRAVNAHKKRRAILESRQRLPRSAFAPVPQGQGAGHPLAGLQLQHPQERKGDFRQLWIQRINAAARKERHDVQPPHPGSEGRQHRGGPQDPRGAGRQRRQRVRRARRGRAEGASGRRERPEGPRRRPKRHASRSKPFTGFSPRTRRPCQPARSRALWTPSVDGPPAGGPACFHPARSSYGSRADRHGYPPPPPS